jgi:hypothetical protein
MSEHLQMTIAYDEPDEEGWIVARVVDVPGALSQGRTRRSAGSSASLRPSQARRAESRRRAAPMRTAWFGS